MFYLTRMLGKPVVDAAGVVIGEISDIAIATGEVFPRVTSLAFLGPDKAPLVLSWRKYVASLDDDRIELTVERSALRFSYPQPDEVLLARDLLGKWVVDTQGKKVVRVRDLKFTETPGQPRLLGAEVGIRGRLRYISPLLERAAEGAARLIGQKLPENLIAWNYVDLLDRDLSQVRLSVTHKRLHELHPADIADIVEALEPAHRAKVFSVLDDRLAAEAFTELEDDYQTAMLEQIDPRRAADILDVMEPDEATDILGSISRPQAEELLRLMNVEESRLIRSLLGYEEDSAGGVMTPDVVTVRDDASVAETLEHLRDPELAQAFAHYVYAVDHDGRVTGVISLHELLVADPTSTLAEVSESDVISVLPGDDQESVAALIGKYNLLAVPVITPSGELLGAVTIDDVLDILQQEHTEDFEKLMAISGEHSTRAYLSTPALQHFSKRVGWVAALAVVGFLSGAVISNYEHVLAKVMILTLYLPMLADTGGNTGSQASTVVIRALATGELVPGDIFRVLRKELTVSLLMAVVVSVIAFGRVFLYGKGLDLSLGLTLPQVGLAVSMAIALQVVTSTLIGAGLPIGATKLGLDPAIVSSPALTTIVDITGLLIYFNVTSLMLGL